jgi:hypothetical protein
MPPHGGQNAYAIERVLDRAEVRKVNQQLLSIGRIGCGTLPIAVGMI